MDGSSATTAVPPILSRLDRPSELDQGGALDDFGISGLPARSVVVGLLDQSDDCVKVIGIDGSLQFMNCNGKTAMQIDDFSAFAGRPWHSLWPDGSQHAVQQAVVEARDGRTNRFEAFCPTAKGEARWWEVTVSPLLSSDGTVAGILSTSRDISDRYIRDQQLQTIAAEMRHRLRNAHTISAAIVMGATRGAPEHRQFGLELAGRLSRLADVQTHLLDIDGSMTVEGLCNRTLSAFDPAGGRIDCTGCDVVIGEQGGRVLALVLGELATNSLKYGALGRGGQLDVRAAIDGDLLSIRWEETFDPGVDPAIEAPPSSGQGMLLIKRMTALMNGEVEGEVTETGYRAHVRVPLDKLAK